MTQTSLPTDNQVLQAILRQRLAAFVARAFETLNPGAEFQPEWFVDYISSKLEPLKEGEQLKLIVNLPPRHLKSTIISVALVAWLMGHNPALRIIVASYSDELAEQLTRDYRRIITSPWYAELFPAMRIGEKDTAREIVTTQNGYRLGVSVGGTLTGRGADIIIVDDPIKAGDATSETKREAVNDWYRHTLISRLDKPKQGSIILVMQRLHDADLTGFLLETGDYEHICLPAIATVNKAYPTGHGLYERKAGEALSPKLQPVDKLEEIKRLQGPTFFSAQYQQEPFAHEGELIKPEHIQLYDGDVPESATIIMSCDTASKTGEANDNSAIIVCAYFNDAYHIIHVVCGKFPLKGLTSRVVELYHHYKSPTLLIEDNGSGTSLIQIFEEHGIWAIGIKPVGSKEDRVLRNLAPFETGRFYVSAHMSLLAEYQRELLSFPKGKHDDMVDATIQILEYWKEKRLPPHITEVGIVYQDKNGRWSDQPAPPPERNSIFFSD